MKELVIYLNAGHGNFENGEHHTFKKDGKFYHFKDKSGKIVHSAYEGQTNRIFADALAVELKLLGIEVVKTYNPTFDLDNLSRLHIANADYAPRKAKDFENFEGLFVSFHSNAFSNSFEGEGTTANGLEFWTSPGTTDSDLFSTLWEKEMQKAANDWKLNIRKDWRDGDSDKEANFTELVGTLMPACLIENLFFTNIFEAKLLHNKNYQKDVVKATVKAILKYKESL